ncbi:MAG: TrkH family potassium uptake protein [Dehalococcoidia bacterium]|nr:TrkH family potassium uptake protein [Dehalococcoidia bacterium]
MQENLRPRRGDVVVRRRRRAELGPIIVTFVPPRISRGTLSSPWFPVMGFALLILLGAFLLWLPWATVAPGFGDPRDAFFTAASAATVTGHAIVDTGSYWTFFGQAVILVLVLVGGLGIMAGATLFYSLLMRHHPITLADTIQVSRSLSSFQLGDVVKLTRNIALVALLVQVGGFLLLFLWQMGQGVERAWWETAWQSAFHTATAFNNAGFTIGTAQTPFVHLSDKITLGFLAVLIVLGSISYFVLADIVTHRHRINRWSLNTKMILTISGVLWLLGAVVLFIGEFRNPATLGGLPLGDQVTSAVFHSVSARTAGFQVVDFAQADEQSLLWFILLMFIGGASGSTAGGIKVTTVGILVAVVLAALTSREQVIAFRREIPARTVHLALTVALLSLGFVAASTLLQTLWGRPGDDGVLAHIPLLHILFDTASAYGTVGLSTGAASELSRWGQLVLVVTMFVGRLGPLTLALVLVRREARQLYHYPQEEVTLG